MDGSNATAKEVLRMAYATSKLNEPGRIADESGELLTLINSRLRSYFADGARTNVRFYAKRLTVAFEAGSGGLGSGWSRPAEAEMIVRLEAGGAMGAVPNLALGTEIVDLPFDQKHIEPARPAVFNFGQRWYSRGLAIDPVSGDLVVFASVRPTKLTTLEQRLDPLWPDVCTPLLKWDVAIYLARKDGKREAEVEAYTAERATEYDSYLKYLVHETTTEVRSYGFGRSFNQPGTTPK